MTVMNRNNHMIEYLQMSCPSTGYTPNAFCRKTYFPVLFRQQGNNSIGFAYCASLQDYTFCSINLRSSHEVLENKFCIGVERKFLFIFAADFNHHVVAVGARLLLQKQSVFAV